MRPSGIRLNKRRLTIKILITLTSHNIPGNTGIPTGFWLEKLTAPTTRSGTPGRTSPWFRSQGRSTTDRSLKRRRCSQTDSMGRLKQDPAARETLTNAVKLDAYAFQLQAERARFEQHCIARPGRPAGSG